MPSPESASNGSGQSPHRFLRDAERTIFRLALLAIVALFSIFGTDRAGDDVYITYSFARSLASGDGFRWAGEPVLGTTSPFLALLLATLQSLIPLGIPFWGHLVTLCSVLALGLLLIESGVREGRARAAGFSALMTASSAWVWSHDGFEWFPALAAAAGAFTLAARRRDLAAGSLLALAAIFRAEAAVAGMALAVVLLRDGSATLSVRLLRILRIAAASAPLLLGWIALLVSLAGTVVPRPLLAKRAQVETGISYLAGGLTDTPRRLFEACHELSPIPKTAPFTALLLVGLAAALLGPKLRTRPVFLCFLLFGPFTLLLVTALGVAANSWYGIPFYLVTTLLLAEISTLHGLLPASLRRTQFVLSTGLCVLLALNLLHELRQRVHESPPAVHRAYRAVASIVDRFPPGTRVGAFEVGFLGWYSHQPVVDLFGLVSPSVPPSLIAERRFLEIRDRLAIDLLVFWLQGGPLFDATFGSAEQFYREFSLADLDRTGAVPFAIYRRSLVAQRGSVELDLTATAVRLGVRTRSIHRQQMGGYVLELLGRESLPFTLPPGGSRRFEANVIGLGGDAELQLVRSTTPVGESRSPVAARAGSWSLWVVNLEASEAEIHLSLHCSEAHDRCGVLAPLIRWQADSDGTVPRSWISGPAPPP